MGVATLVGGQAVRPQPQKQMRADRALTPIALVLLAAGATAYAYFVDRARVSDADRAVRSSHLFPAFQIDAVRRVEFVHGSERLVIERAANEPPEWMLTSPRREKADASAVDALLRELDQAKRVRAVPEGEAAGLDPPRLRGRVSVGPLEFSFALGADAPRPQGAAYARVEGENAIVVSQTLKEQLLRTSDAYRDRTLVPYRESDVGRLEITGGAGDFVLERVGATFRVGGSDGLRASREAVDRIFGGLAEARAELFADDAAADGGATANAPRTVTVIPRDGKQPPVRLRIGGPCPGAAANTDVVVLRTEPVRTCACVAKSAIDALVTTPSALLDRRPLFAHADEIEEVRLEAVPSGSPRVDLARRQAGWHQRAPQDRDLDGEQVDSANVIVAAMTGAQALEVRGPGASESFEATVRASIVRTGTGTTETIEIGPPDRDGISLARRLDDGAIMRLARAAARRFEPHPIALQERFVWPAPFDTARVEEVENSCGPALERIEMHEGRWRMKAPLGFVADVASTTDIVEAFAHAKADQWLAESDDGTFGLANGCAVTLTVAPGEAAGPGRKAGIVFGVEGEGGFYARTLDAPAVFLAPSALHGLARHPAIDRSWLRFEPAAIDHVTLVRGRAKLVLTKVDGRLVRSVPHPDDAGMDDKLARALSGLYSPTALHAGGPAPDEGFDQVTLQIDAFARGDAGETRETRVAIGAPGRDGANEIYFARTPGVDATFAVPRHTVDALLEAW
jgi:Domain of unknown function (DUF4340)